MLRVYSFFILNLVLIIFCYNIYAIRNMFKLNNNEKIEYLEDKGLKIIQAWDSYL
ncbi:unnamed protein product [marine sediment metagenome]|uniref:Uncharacterized protein n=1 Tax=marine sediment metagenome TaxID=412755 RepID=X1QC98_9ZZZZ